MSLTDIVDFERDLTTILDESENVRRTASDTTMPRPIRTVSRTLKEDPRVSICAHAHSQKTVCWLNMVCLVNHIHSISTYRGARSRLGNLPRHMCDVAAITLSILSLCMCLQREPELKRPSSDATFTKEGSAAQSGNTAPRRLILRRSSTSNSDIGSSSANQALPDFRNPPAITFDAPRGSTDDSQYGFDDDDAAGTSADVSPVVRPPSERTAPIGALPVIKKPPPAVSIKPITVVPAPTQSTAPLLDIPVVPPPPKDDVSPNVSPVIRRSHTSATSDGARRSVHESGRDSDAIAVPTHPADITLPDVHARKNSGKHMPRGAPPAAPPQRPKDTIADDHATHHDANTTNVASTKRPLVPVKGSSQPALAPPTLPPTLPPPSIPLPPVPPPTLPPPLPSVPVPTATSALQSTVPRVKPPIPDKRVVTEKPSVPPPRAPTEHAATDNAMLRSFFTNLKSTQQAEKLTQASRQGSQSSDTTTTIPSKPVPSSFVLTYVVQRSLSCGRTARRHCRQLKCLWMTLPC